jgi:hypothetical protein
MISIRSVIGALRKTLKICESVLVRKVDVSGTSKGGIGLGLRDQNVLVVRSHRSTGGTRCLLRVCQSRRQQRCRF